MSLSCKVFGSHLIFEGGDTRDSSTFASLFVGLLELLLGSFGLDRCRGSSRYHCIDCSGMRCFVRGPCTNWWGEGFSACCNMASNPAAPTSATPPTSVAASTIMPSTGTVRIWRRGGHFYVDERDQTVFRRNKLEVR